jgi:hypothetical protein
MLIKHYENDELILEQLLSLALFLDYHDEAGRRLLNRLLCTLTPLSTSQIKK